MPRPIHLALVPVAKIKFNDVAKVSAAIQKQIIRDFSPIWSVDATIDAFPAPTDVPVGYWPIFIVDTFDKGGQHKTVNNQPFGLVAAGSSWSLAASHEALEMLVDPSGDRLVPARQDETSGRDPCARQDPAGHDDEPARDDR